MIVSAKDKLKENRKKGIYHTKQELVDILIDRINGLCDAPKSVCDPCCGVGNLLMPFINKAECFGFDVEKDFTLKAQERGIKAENLSCLELDKSGLFDLVIGNYPFSLRDADLAVKSRDLILRDERFKGIPPFANILDFAFLFKHLSLIKSGGYGAIISSNGLAYRGQKEAKLREFLVNLGWLVSIEVMEGKFFDDTQISVLLLLFDTSKTNKDVTFIEGDFQRLVPYDEIVQNDFNLNINRYKPYEDEEPISPEGFMKQGLDVNSLTANNLKNSFEMCLLLDSLESGVSQFDDLMAKVLAVIDEVKSKRV